MPDRTVIDAAEAFAAVAAWAPTKRWFPLKGTAAQLTLAATLPVRDDVAVLLVRAGATLLQVPVALRSEPGAEPIGRVVGGWLVDACHDTEAVQALLAGSVSIAADGAVPRAAVTRVISGEQSNTSVIGEGPKPWIAKIFRVVDAGENPDVVVTGALTRAGCDRVPALVAATSAALQDTAGRAHLAAVSEFIGGAADAWELLRTDAVRALRGEARSDVDAHGLGVAVAEVHVALAGALGEQTADTSVTRRTIDGLQQRAAWARERAGAALAGLESAIDAHVTALAGLTVGAVQQIHGDLHLGQVLRHPERGYLLLDFEGEPLRPLAERLVPEPAERDIAGMLRSFDYAAGSAAIEVGVDVAAADAWTRDIEHAFFAGYRTTRSHDADESLMRALVIDKALYEVVYEAQNRPDWVPIPVVALRRLLA